MTHHISPALQRADPSFASIPDPLTNFCSSSRPLEIWTSFAQGKHENNGFVLSFHFNSFLIYTKNNKNPPRDIIQSLIIHNPILSLPAYATKRRRCVTSCRRLRLVWSLSTHKLRLYQSNNDINPSFLLAFGSIFNWITYVGETTACIFYSTSFNITSLFSLHPWLHNFWRQSQPSQELIRRAYSRMHNLNRQSTIKKQKFPIYPFIQRNVYIKISNKT